MATTAAEAASRKTIWRRAIDGAYARVEARRHHADFDGVTCYVTFVGHPRNGSTLVGALLDAHPDAVVCHELGALELLAERPSRDLFYYRHLRRARWFHEAMGGKWSGYDYRVPGTLQGGRYRTLRVVGDKRARLAAVRLGQRPQLADELAALTGVRLAWINVVRDPFDNLATMVQRKGRAVEDEVERYFVRCQAIDALRRRFPADVIDIFTDDLAADAARELERLRAHVGLAEESDWLRAAAATVHPSPSRTRDAIEWPDAAVADIRARLAGFDWLARFL